MRFCFGAQIAFVFSRLLYICFRASSHALQRAIFMPLRCSIPTGTQESRHAGACRLTACDKGLPPQAWPTGLDFGSGFVRFRLFLQLVLGRCFCNRFGGFGFFQRAGDDVN